jgi:cyanophycinase
MRVTARAGRSDADPGADPDAAVVGRSAMAAASSHGRRPGASGPASVRVGSRPVYSPPTMSGEGTVIVIGGAEDKIRDRVILQRFVALAGGSGAHLAVVGSASSFGVEAAQRYGAIFGDLGVRHIDPVQASTREEANDGPTAAAVRAATGIFLTGGNQLKLVSIIGGTRLADAIRDAFQAGAVVAGTSAGASAMSSHMIAFGTSGSTPKQRMAQIAAGLGVLPGVIVDQHFQQRNRIGRLLSLVAQNPSLLGLGVDEDTAGIVGPDRVMEVIGRGSVTVVDGSGSETDAWDVRGHRPVMISNVVLHSLPAGYRFDLVHRRRVSTTALRALAGIEAASS